MRFYSPTDKPFSNVGGVYYLWNKWGVDQILDFCAPGPLPGALNHFYEQNVNSYSGFVQVNASPFEAVKLTAGARYTRETYAPRLHPVAVQKIGDEPAHALVDLREDIGLGRIERVVEVEYPRIDMVERKIGRAPRMNSSH